MRAAYAELAGDELPPGDWPAALHAALSRNEIVFRLNEELGVPKALAELPPALASDTSGGRSPRPRFSPG